MAYLSHGATCLSVHEPDQENIAWMEGKEAEKELQLKRGEPTSQLTAWFALNKMEGPVGDKARQLTFFELPEFFK